MLTIELQGTANLQKTAAHIEKAQQYAVSRTAQSTGTQWARAIAQEINLPVSVIKEAIHIQRVNQTEVNVVVDSRNVAALSTTRQVRSIPVMVFNPVQKAHGVAVKIKKSKGRQMMPSAWIGGVNANSGKLHKGVFYRETKARLPIQEAKTTALEEVAQDTMATVKTAGQAKLGQEFSRILKLTIL